MRPHVAVFLQHYHTPDCPTSARPHALVDRLSRDFEVTLITTDAWRSRQISHTTAWVPPGVRLVEFEVPYGNKMGPARRLASFARYALQAAWAGLRLPPPDVVFGSSTPLTVPLVAALVARWHDVPWVFEVRDLWPDFPIQMGAVSSPLVRRMLYGLEKWLYCDAAHVVALSSDMAEHIRRTAPSAAVDVNVYGTDRDVLNTLSPSRVRILQEQYGLGDARVVLYAGSFGRANAIPTLIRTAEQLHADPSLPETRFVFAGDGYHRPTLDAARKRVPSIRLLPPLPMHDALALFRLADLSVVSFLDRPVLATNSPGKLFDSLAAATPVIVTNPGWTRDLVETHRCGWYVSPESPGALAQCIRNALLDLNALHMYGDSAAGMARRCFNRSTHMDRYVRLVEQVVATEGAGRRCAGSRRRAPL